MEVDAEISDTPRGPCVLEQSPDQLQALAAALDSQPEEDLDPAGGTQVASPPAADRPSADGGDDRTPGQSAPGPPTVAAAYVAACAAAQEQPFGPHLVMLQAIPDSLYAAYNPWAVPHAKAGGAALHAAAPAAAAAQPSPLQLDALLATLGKSSADHVLLLDHLSLSGAHLPAGWLGSFVAASASLGPWRRLRSLELAGCGLSLEDVAHLSDATCAPAVAHLQRLDLSGNFLLGRSPGGAARAAAELMAEGRLLLLDLWRAAPLRLLDLTGTGLSSAALAVMLRMLRLYTLPSAAPSCAVYLHDGARPALQCLRVGPPGEGPAFSAEAVGELASLAAAAPQLVVLEVRGLCAEQRGVLEEAWCAAQHARGLAACAVAEARAGVVRLAAGPGVERPLPVEAAPQGHTLPGPDTPPQRAEQARPVEMDDWTADLGHAQGESGGAAAQGESGGGGGGQRGGRQAAAFLMPPRQPAVVQTARHLAARRAAGGAGGGGSGGGGRSSGGGGGGGLHAYYGGAAQPRGEAGRAGAKRPRSAGGSRQAARPARVHRGGDQLPDGGIDLGDHDDRDDLMQEQDEEDSDAATSAGESERSGSDGEGGDLPGGGAGAVAVGPGAQQADADRDHQFRVRNGRVDNDSKLGKLYRFKAREFCKELPDADRAAALRAFRNWDSQAVNAWDRKRWVNPSHDQKDEPWSLNSLNLLLDLFHKHGKQLDFPFPQRVPGAGAEAFAQDNAPRPQVVLPRPAQPAPPAARQAAGAAPAQGAAKRKRSGSRFVDGGGHGRDSDGEEAGDDEDAAFLKSDGEGSSSGSGSDSEAGGGSPPPAPGPDPSATQPGPRRRQVLESSSDEDDSPSRPAPSAKAASRAAREVARLAAWDWDSRKEQHPPNQEAYAPAQGKRSRRKVITDTQLQAALESQDVEVAADAGSDGEGSAGELQGGTAAAAAAAPASAFSSSSDDDDDEPLVQLRRRDAEEAPELQDVEAEMEGEVAEEEEAAPAVEPPPEGPSPAERAAVAAQMLLGNLYVSPPPAPPAFYGIALPRSAALDECMDEEGGVIPDSEDEAA